MAQVQSPPSAPGTAPSSTSPAGGRPLPALISELWDLVVAYAKQETLDPLRSLGRFIGFGVAGALLMVVGLVLISAGGLRALQVETNDHLTGNWSWAPYGILAVFCLAVAGLAGWAIFRRPKELP